MSHCCSITSISFSSLILCNFSILSSRLLYLFPVFILSSVFRFVEMREIILKYSRDNCEGISSRWLIDWIRRESCTSNDLNLKGSVRIINWRNSSTLIKKITQRLKYSWNVFKERDCAMHSNRSSDQSSDSLDWIKLQPKI